jgi:hypothetical protein
MQEVYDFYRESPTVVYNVLRRLVTSQLITQADVSDIRYTIFEQDSPSSNAGTPVPYFDEVILDKTKIIFDELKPVQYENKYGIFPIEINFAHVIAPIISTNEGVETKIFPFPNLGRCYRVLYSFRSANPEVPHFSVQAIGYAV